MALPDVAPGSRIEWFRGPSGGTGSIAVTGAGETARRPIFETDEGPAWVLLAIAPSHDVTLEFEGGPDGLDVDAVRLRVAEDAE
jgi:hypothetical protein